MKSFGEKVIANALFEHDIAYRYERSFRWDGTNYRPDFTVATSPRTGIVIEYFGLAGDADYDAQTHAKRRFWAGKEGWTLLEFTPNDIASRGARPFVERLLNELAALGLSPRRLSDEEIWSRIKDRAIDSFSGSMATFIGRCRTRSWDEGQLRQRIQAHTAALDSERLFLETGADLLARYLTLLAQDHKEDFSGLVWRATAAISSGQTAFVRDRGREVGDVADLRHVLIDEFQDFSEMFFKLVQSLRSAAPHARIMAVGDDWQAINGFAGSDLRFFNGFSDHFPGAGDLPITTNYRSGQRVVAIGNALMAGKGFPSVADRTEPGRVDLCALDRFEPSATEADRHGGDVLTPALLRLIKRELDQQHEVVLLSRTNTPYGWMNYEPTIRTIAHPLDRMLEHLRTYLSEEDRGRVTISTAHKFKGLQRHAVIVIDAVSRRYPFVHPAWSFFRVFGDDLRSIDDAERRLFYVALTRAEHGLTIVTDTHDESPFLADIRHGYDLTALKWGDVAPMPSPNGERLEIRVYNAYDVRDHLKRAQYRWENSDKSWRRSVPAEGFEPEILMRQSWAVGKVRIEVCGEDGRVRHRL